MPELVSDLYNQEGNKRSPGDDVGFFESALELAIHMAPKYAIVHKTAGTQIRTGFHQP